MLPFQLSHSYKFNLQASQQFQPLWSTEVETCEESGWWTLHSPSIHSHYPCSLLPAEGEERAALAGRLWMRLLQHISDNKEDDPLTYGVMPLELKAVRAGLLDGTECFFVRIPQNTYLFYLFQTHFMSAAVGAAALALSSSVLFYCHMAAEKLQYMFQISPWGMRLTSVTNPPKLSATHSSSHLFHILHRMWVTRICINYTVWAIYWEIKGWYLKDLAQWSYNNISLPLMIKYSTLKGEEERTAFKRKQVCFVLQLSTVNISVRLVLNSERQNVRGEKKGQLFWSRFKMIKWSWHHTESHCGWSDRLQTFTSNIYIYSFESLTSCFSKLVCGLLELTWSL